MLSAPIAALLIAGIPAPEVTAIVGSFRYDPVLLVKTGKKEVGALTISHERYAYRYHFTSEENRREFLARPERYQIQLGGGCGKMGSLSGRGNPDRFAVHQGLIYVFASDSCRSHFLAAPDRYLEVDDPKPVGTSAEAAAGKRLIAKALEWAGGAQAWRKLAGYQEELRESVKSGNTTYDHRLTTAVAWPDKILRTDKWNESAYSDLFEGKNGYFLNATSTTPMDPQQVRALQRVRNRALPSVLKAAAGKGFLAYDRGAAPSGFHRVESFFDRTQVLLEIEPRTGEIRAMEFNGRRQIHARERWDFNSFATLDNLKLPTGWMIIFDGKESGKRLPEQTTYQLSVDSVQFALPK